jgi:excinuclease UvrABC nuclease subunit
MIFYAKNREFEKAGEIKRQIFALQHINDIALLRNEGFAHVNFLPLRPSLGASGSKWDPRRQKIHISSTRIEAYDIAHMGGKNMVGVMTVVEDGEVVKSEYKKFKIRTQSGANDTGALKEILERRLAHKEWTYPNLIVIDGGVAQMNVSKSILKKMNLKITVVSVVKDERHKPKAILGNEEIIKKHKSQILLSNSEAHRFAIAYHKNMRGKNFLK